jgi:DNA mismatch repair protein MutS2
MDREQEKLRARLGTVADREIKVRERERESEKVARQEARKYLLEARGQVERAIADIRTKAGEQMEALEEAARAARRAVEDAAAEQGAAVDAVQQRAARERAKVRAQVQAAVSPVRPTTAQKPIVEGDRVLVATLDNKSGHVVSVRGGDARVVVGSLTVTVPLASLTRTSAPPPPAVKVSYAGSVPEGEPVREVDVRGMRVDELGDHVLHALDSAIRADLRELRIIHGKGTGALRARVSEMLKKDTRVAGFRLGAWNEGGAGVTVAELT